jgi:endonuclease-3
MLKRTAASGSTKLAARASPYHPSVTLLETDGTEILIPPDSLSPRRSKRIKLETTPTPAIVDLEETVRDIHSEPKRTRKKADNPSAPQTKRAAKSPRKSKPIQQSLEVPHPAPPQWRETYDALKQMRSRFVAPVDTMGCDQAQYKEEDPKVSMDVALPSHVCCHLDVFLNRINDLPPLYLSCFRRKLKMKLRMLLSRNYASPLEEV